MCLTYLLNKAHHLRTTTMATGNSVVHPVSLAQKRTSRSNNGGANVLSIILSVVTDTTPCVK